MVAQHSAKLTDHMKPKTSKTKCSETSETKYNQTHLLNLSIDPNLFADKLNILTDATGFVGSLLLHKLLTLNLDSHIVLLTRSHLHADNTSSTAADRIRHMLSFADVFATFRVSHSQKQLDDLFSDRLTVLESDLSKPRLNLADNDLEVIKALSAAKKGVKIVLCGANVNFFDSLQNLLSANVLSVLHFMRLAEELGAVVENFVYVSTGKI